MRLPLSLRFAGRELRAGVSGFRIFLACLALGVAAIAAAGSTAEAFRAGLASQAREILGGDLAVTIEQRRFTPAERAAIEKLGQVAWAVRARGMAEAASGERRLVELRGVAGAYPLAGKVELEGAASLEAALARRGEAYGAAVEEQLLTRLGLKVGDRFLVGEIPMVVGAVLKGEPDRLSRGFALGPRVLTQVAAVEQGGFLTVGLPFGETARIGLAPGADPAAAAKALERALPGREFRIRDRDDAAPGAKRMIDQLEYFLGFIGLASLVAGGLGVYGAVIAYLDGRKLSMAVLKALGGEGRLVRNLYLAQIAALALLGVVIGLAIGAAIPFAIGGWLREELPIPALFAFYPVPLLKAAGFGLLSAAAFSLAPLARARTTPPASLFRRDLAGRPGFSIELIGAIVAALALAGLAIATAPTPFAAVLMIGGVAVSFAVLGGMGWAATRLAARMRGLARGPIRLGLANLAGPRSAALTATPAIGLAVALLAAVVLIQSSLLRQIAEVAPRAAPSLVFTEIPGDQTAAFDAAVGRAFGEPLSADTFQRTPMITGRIVSVRGTPVEKLRIAPNARWAYDNDITLSAVDGEPTNAKVLEGRWWPVGYEGPPLLAIDFEAAAGAGIEVGDAVTLSILGREIPTEVAVLRDVDLGGFGANFAMMVNEAALEGASPRHVAIAKASRIQERAVTRALGQGFPEVNVISVREQLEAATDLFARLTLAVRGAAAVAALAGLLVLAGAIAARARARMKEAAVLKVLGASRVQILAAYTLEYGLVGAAAGVLGVALGYAAAWPVVVKVFESDWSVDWAGVAALVGGAALLAGLGGLAAAMQALSRRPAPALRTD